MQATDSSAESWDFFISFSDKDRARSEELAEWLEKQGWRVFHSRRSIDPGAEWEKLLHEGVEGSRVMVVLLSEHSEGAHYQREEIRLAVNRARQQELKLVPVYLTGVPGEPQPWEFGLRGYQWIDFHEDGLEKTAKKLGRVLEVEPTSGPQNSGAHRTIGEMLFGAALRIDRSNQWLPVVEICSSSENALFLLHGARQQNLDLFVLRIWHYLAEESDAHQRVFVVPLRVEYAKPRSAAAWENHLRVGIAGEGKGGTAEELLGEAARSHPVFLILSGLPIAAGDLDEVELAALEEFLGDGLPQLISRAAMGRHPIRALLATHYDSEEKSLVERLDAKALEGCEGHGVRYRKLPPLRALEWEDVEDFLDGLPKRPPRHVYEQLKAAFEQLDRGTMQFRDVVELLARELY